MKFLRMTDEEAMAAAALLQEKDRNDDGSSTVITGVHPTLGRLHIVIPPGSDSIVFGDAFPPNPTVLQFDDSNFNEDDEDEEDED